MQIRTYPERVKQLSIATSTPLRFLYDDLASLDSYDEEGVQALDNFEYLDFYL